MILAMQSNRNNRCIIPTADGSNTLVHPGNGQSYHSMNGALQEARHVFLQNGLIHFLAQNGLTSARILEVGFGAGLNFTVSAAYCLENRLSLQYTGLEPFTIGKNLLYESSYKIERAACRERGCP